MTTKDLQQKTIKQLAVIIAADWNNVSVWARPYLDAMSKIDHITDQYMLDSAASVVLYFLSNASPWRTEVAKQVKSELKRRLRLVGYVM